MLTRERSAAGHVDRVFISETETGWEVREERDSKIVKRASYTDWHRVERALYSFDLAARLPVDQSTNR